MAKTERIARLRELLLSRTTHSLSDLAARLEVSTATVKRDIEYLRDRLRAPIVYDRGLNGYIFEIPTESGIRADDLSAKGSDLVAIAGAPQLELPGLWFTAEELVALLSLQHMLERLEPGLLGEKIAPLRSRLKALLREHEWRDEEVEDRIRLVHARKRLVDPRWFAAVAKATMARKQLEITHFHRQRGESLSRRISPQRIVHYRDNWYVDAWCHRRNALRSFAIDAITNVQLCIEDAKELNPDFVTGATAGSYGIFGGSPEYVARLRFSAKSARWVSRESWHPQQRGSFDEDGRFLLDVPYANDIELISDILRHGPEVEILGPEVLIDTYVSTLRRMLDNAKRP